MSPCMQPTAYCCFGCCKRPPVRFGVVFSWPHSSPRTHRTWKRSRGSRKEKICSAPFFPTYNWRLRLVRSAARLEEVPSHCRRFFGGADVEAHGSDLPLVLLLFDYWPLERYDDLPFRRRWLRLSVEKLPLLLMSAASSAVTVAAQRSVIVDTSALAFSLRLGNAILSYVAYIRKMFWPVKLAVFYPHPKDSLLWSDVIAAAVILAAISMAVLYLHHARTL